MYLHNPPLLFPDNQAVLNYTSKQSQEDILFSTQPHEAGLYL